MTPVQCERTKPATDEDEVLFKVAVVPIEMAEQENDKDTPLQRAINLPGFALVVSMNHTLGDGHTYYRLYGMLSAEAEIEELDPVRVTGFEEAKAEVVGENENAVLSSAGVSMGIAGGYYGSKLRRRGPQNVCVNEVDLDWVAQEKAKAKQDGQVPFISTNDTLTSWWFREMGTDLNLMVANFRSGQPTVFGLDDQNVGNYEANVAYFPGDIESPVLIRKSIRGDDGTFRARRAGSPTTLIPSFWTLLHNNSSLITNWATFYRDVNLEENVQDNKESRVPPKLHLPIMETDGIIASVWNNAIIFRPRAGELGVLMITRHFDSDMLAEQQAKDGANAPMGACIV